MLKHAILLLFVILLSACSNEGVSQQTLVAFEAQLDEQRDIIGATNTAELETLLLTLDYSYVELTRTHAQRNNMNLILVTRGVTVEVPTLAPTQPAMDTPSPFVTPDADQMMDVIVTPFMTATIEVILPTATPNTADVGIPSGDEATLPANNNLRDIMLSSGVGDDDCAIDRTTTFTTQSERIYIVARAFDVMPNTEISSIWRRGDEQLVTFPFTPTFPINDACIWFFADPTDFSFDAGVYDVTLSLNGQPITAPISFTIE